MIRLKGNIKNIIQQSERVFIYGGIAILLFVKFFILLSVYLKAMDESYIVLVMVSNALAGFILMSKAFKERKELDKIKEVEYLREIIKDINRKENMENNKNGKNKKTKNNKR